jgi:hypothetical protein
MKSPSVYLPKAALILTAAFVVPAAAQKRVPVCGESLISSAFLNSPLKGYFAHVDGSSRLSSTSPSGANSEVVRSTDRSDQ